MQPGEHDTLATSIIPGSARPSRRVGPRLHIGGGGRTEVGRNPGPRQGRPAEGRHEPPADTVTPPVEPSEGVRTSRICVVIPAFNEAGSVARVIQRAQRAIPEAHVVVVNDGSKDDTAVRALQAGATVISLPVNLGIGGAVQAGYLYALRHGFDIAIQVDGDDQHDPAEIERLLDPIRTGTAEMTVGSRWLGRGDYVAPAGRRIAMRLLATLVRWRTGGTFTDTTSGFRAVGARGIALFARTYPTDFPEVESLVLASRNGLRVQEVPVRMTPRSHGQSSIAGIRLAYYMARVTVALVIGSLNRKDTSKPKEAP
jgi:glycosyltransferase involved in cell wall biosynthesis